MKRELQSAFVEVRKGRFASLLSKSFEYLLRRFPPAKDYVNSRKVNLKIERILRANKSKKASFTNISIVYLLYKSDPKLLSRSIFSLKKLVSSPHVVIIDLGENTDEIWNLIKNYLPKAERMHYEYGAGLNEILQKIAEIEDIRDYTLLINEYPKFNEIVNVLDRKELMSDKYYCLDFLYPRREIKNYYINKSSINFYENLNLFRCFFPLFHKDLLSHIKLEPVFRSEFTVLPAALTLKELNHDLDKNSPFRNYFSMKFSVENVVPDDNLNNYKLPFDKKISIIILTKNHRDLLEPCLKSIEKSNYSNYEIIIVDHESNEETKEWLRGLPYKVIPYQGVFNFSIMNNLAVEYATGDILCFLNNDTEVISEYWLDVLGSFAIQPDIGAVGPKLLFQNNLIQHAGIMVNKNFNSVSHVLTYEKDNNLSKELNVISTPDAVTGACLFVSRDKFIKAGGFNEEYIVTWQDIDLCLSLGILGYTTLFVPYVKLYHYESSTRKIEPTENEKQDLSLFKSRWQHLTKGKERETGSFDLRKLKGLGGRIIKNERK